MGNWEGENPGDILLNMKRNMVTQKIKNYSEDLAYFNKVSDANWYGTKYWSEVDNTITTYWNCDVLNPDYTGSLTGEALEEQRVEARAVTGRFGFVMGDEWGGGLFTPYDTQRDLELEERYLKMLSSLNPQGVIYTCNPSSCFMETVEQLSNKIPFAVINNQNERLNVDAVELDNSKLGRIMAKHLLELGHTHVAYIAPPLTVRQKQRSKRVEGFLKEFQKAGLGDHVVIKAADEQIDKDVPGIDSEYRIGYDLTKELLKEHTDLTAIVGLNDMIAFGILDALYEEKYKVPGEMSVMGCDNTLFARMHHIALTTVEHFVIYKGRDACDIIMKKIKARSEPYAGIEPVSIYHVEYEPQIVMRGTTGYPNLKKRKISTKK